MFRSCSTSNARNSRSCCCLARVSSSSRRLNSTAENSLAALSKGVGASLRRAPTRGRLGEAADCGDAGVVERRRRLAGSRLRGSGVASAGGAGGAGAAGVAGAAGRSGGTGAEGGTGGPPSDKGGATTSGAGDCDVDGRSQLFDGCEVDGCGDIDDGGWEVSAKKIIQNIS